MDTHTEPTPSSSSPRSPLGIAILAIALYVALIDAAVETFLSGWAVRWWVAGVVAAYLAFSVGLWRYRRSAWEHMGWPARASTSFFLLLALLAFTVWLPGGLDDGIRLAGAQTSTVLSLLTAVAIVLAGVSLVRRSWLPRWTKFVIGFIATYGLVAFAKGIISGTTYTELLHGQSFWSWLPFWLQGSFLSLGVVVALGVLTNFLGSRPEPLPKKLSQVAVLLSVIVLATAGISRPAESRSSFAISQRGPGLKSRSLDSLQLPVPRTFDLTHVQPEYFAAALGKDPVRIFEFVRDQIAYESYEGCLRGPRGTLLGMAGNSVDRASLLASMLQHAGQRVRYAHGTLPEPLARELVTSMWAERAPPQPAKIEENPSLALKNASDTLVAGVKRDYQLIRDHLKKMDKAPARKSEISLDSLVKEARAHYWVQWAKDGSWIDLDPSFADARLGQSSTRAEETLDTLPDTIFHRVAIRVRLEEYTDNAPSSRLILSYAAKAADLSGVDVVLSHQPENWKAPANSLQAAIASAIADTGKVRPVLIIGRKDWIAGEPFRPRPPSGQGIGAIGDLLGGAGTRNPVAIATAETVEFDFIYPGPRTETVVREIFDLVGKARRTKGQKLSADEVRAQTGAKTAFDVTRSIYDIFLTTGRIEAGHLIRVADKQPREKSEFPSIRAGLRRMNITFAVASDALLPRIGKPESAVILFYPDSPRVQIAEMATIEGKPRLSLDLRRDHTRELVIGPHSEDIFFARLLRGIIDSTLERSLIEFVNANAHDDGWGPVISTSSVLERARAESVPVALLTGDGATLAEGISEDTRARIREDLRNGYLVVVPKQTIAYEGQSRYAWWRIDMHSGEVLGITEEGLHQAVEYCITGSEEEGYEVDVFVNGRYSYTTRITAGFEDLANYIRFLERVRGAVPIDPDMVILHLYFPG